MKKKSASKKRNQQLKDEIEGLHKQIARMKDAEYNKILSIRKMIEASYHRWLVTVERSDSYKQIQKEHPLLRWGQPLKLNMITGLPTLPKNYPRGIEGWYADTLFFATRTGTNFSHYRFYKECKKAGLLIGDPLGDFVHSEPTPSEVARMDANEEHVYKYQFGDEEKRKKIIAILERKYGNNN